MRTLVIKSSEWLRGTGPFDSTLHDGEKYCCLGLDAKACGYPDDYLINRGTPEDIIPFVKNPRKKKYLQNWMTKKFNDTNRLCERAMTVNDDASTSDEQKISKLRRIFKSKGINIVWKPNE